MGAEILQNNKNGSFKNENAYFLSDSQLINSDSKKEKRILDTSTVSNTKQKEMVAPFCKVFTQQVYARGTCTQESKGKENIHREHEDD